MLLNAILEPDGRAHDITVEKHFRADMESSAVKAVENWKFKPAIGPGGRPTAVKMLIEIDFYLR